MKTKTTFITILWLLFSMNASAQNNWNTMLIEVWSDASTWENEAQAINSFDSNGYLTNNLFQSWDAPTTAWQNSFQTNYTNNANGTVNSAITQLWNAGWENQSKTDYLYNVAGDIANYYSYYWIDSWTEGPQGTYTYDENGYLVNTLVQQQDFLGGGLINQSQINYTNNANGTVNQSVLQLAFGDIWQNELRSTYTYNAQDKVLTELTEQWAILQWVNTSLESFTYDGSGYLIHTLEQAWNDSSWQNERQSMYTNTPSGDPVEIISQDWQPNNTWLNASRITFGYNLGVDELANSNYKIVPNPAANQLTVEGGINLYGVLSIIDTNGRVVLRKVVIGNEPTVDVSGLNSGIYFLRISDGNPVRFVKN